ncbi:hypothetical protein SeLEV6574_g04864 [Synchytrium endobioticum]|uniref:Uncharacterized protein n=1 Tax=Synchytrium endobioticum TaxID=286115 RepID=A0A507CY17_9FUNG|nr:hypothetical protein SeLEV6574_g04864 [Synchytrium endobioticum]
MHSRQHRQVPAMSRLSKIHMVIVIIVFLVLHIRAADDKEKMKKLAVDMARLRCGIATKAKGAQGNHDLTKLSNQIQELSTALRARERYKPAGNILRLEDLLQEPSAGDSKERLNLLMEVHAYQYEVCETIRFKIAYALGPNGLPRAGTSKSIQRQSKRLANLMQRHLSLEVKYGIALDVVAPHIQTILAPSGKSSHEWDPEIKALRLQRENVVHHIGQMKNNEIPVSPENARDEWVLGWSLWSSPEGCTMEPNSGMTDLQLHRIIEYNALWSEMCRYKYEQLRVVLDYASTLREMLQFRQRVILEQWRTYFVTACKYAQELIERHVYASLLLGGKRPPFEEMDGNGGGNELHISEGNVPGASSEWVEPNYDLEDWNMLSQILESGGPSVPFQELLVDNQASTGSYHVEPYPPISQGFTCNQDFVCQSSPGVEAYGSEAHPHHGITPNQHDLPKELFDFDKDPVDEYWGQTIRHYPPVEENVMPSWPWYHHNAHADEAGSSNEQQYRFDRH